ncbi:MAG: lambda exonuclease family protein, partial [Chloroflexota bacterium]
MAKIFWKTVQGTPDWFRIRAGIPTASEFASVVTPKKGELASARHKYACRLIAQRLMNWQAESLDTIKHIEDGRVNEPFAVAQLEAISEIKTHRVGFVLSNSGRYGASPDRAVGGPPDVPDGIEDGALDVVLEVKSPTIPKQFEYLLLGHDDAYRCQVQGQLFVAEADKAIFYSYQNRMPAYHVETGRDEPFIRKMAGALEQFSDELEALMEKAQGLGVYQA